jgi:hypothetical protein
MKRRALIPLLILIVADSSNLDAFEVSTHEILNNKAAQSVSPNGFSLDAYLKSNLAFTNGIDERLIDKLNGRSVLDYIKDGGIHEDDGHWYQFSSRYLNHFHNPLKPWDQAGFNNYLLFTGESSLLWTQRPLLTQNTFGNWSWHDARNYYYNALTNANSTTREYSFADTFRAVGQVMHLVEDASVPAHTRNDPHIFYNYEKWVMANENSLNTTPVFSTAPLSVSIGGYVPITQFWDTNQYDGSFPLTGTDIGIAEYSNANFFSEDTFKNDDPNGPDFFPYPDKSLTELWTDQSNNRKYLRSIGRGEPVQHQAAVSVLYWYRLTYFPQYSSYLPLGLDDKSYEEQANYLVPRAVGYSAGLLNYFFRGQLDIIPDPLTGLGYVIVNNTEEDMDGTFQIYYDNNQGNRVPLWSPASTFTLGTKSSGYNKSSNFSISPPGDAQESGIYILVFNGRLGGEQGAVVGRVVQLQPYLVLLKVDHSTREATGPFFYGQNSNTPSQLDPVTESQLPFTVMDDGAYWDPNTSSWTAKGDPQGLGVPLGVGGPQSIAKYFDGSKIRYILNESYEKEAYDAFHFVPKENGQVIKDLYYLKFTGSAFGKYNENPGWMDYTPQGLLSILSPPPANPQTRFFSLYKGANFNDIFVQAPVFRFYNFDNSIVDNSIPIDPNAPQSSIVSAYRSGTDDVAVSIPSVFNTYVRPNSYWVNSPTMASSGLDNYLFHSLAAPTFVSHADKCSVENNNCGDVYDPNQGAQVVQPVYDIPYNDNSYVRVHFNDGGQYYEELYIHGQLRETSIPSPDKLTTHYQILAAHKDVAVVRETNLLSEQDLPMDYYYSVVGRIHEKQKALTAQYYIYVNGSRYNFTGTTNITFHLLDYTNEPSAGQPVDYLTFEPVEDITGYHLDRIFINESLAGGNVLVAFDEYTYNNGAGLVHSLHYDPSDIGNGKYILYYSIPPTQIQNADHEGTRVGRQLLLFGSNGTLQQSLQDPVGLGYTIGSIGILN